MSECIFCKIVAGEAGAAKIWEDDKHLAFLSIFPNTEGFSVVITKEHHPSYVVDLPDDVSSGLLVAAKRVSKILDTAFSDVGRTGIMFEGFGVNHIHAKLFPMHGTKTDAWRQWKSDMKKYFEHYEGYISSHDHERVNDDKLEKLAEKIRAALK